MIAPKNEEITKDTLKKYWQENKVEIIVAGTFAIFGLIILNGLLSGDSSGFTDMIGEHPLVIYLVPN